MKSYLRKAFGFLESSTPNCISHKKLKAEGYFLDSKNEL